MVTARVEGNAGDKAMGAAMARRGSKEQSRLSKPRPCSAGKRTHDRQRSNILTDVDTAVILDEDEGRVHEVSAALNDLSVRKWRPAAARVLRSVIRRLHV